MHLYAKVSTSLGPYELSTVGPFDDAFKRAQWLCDTLPSELRTLSRELKLGGKGIRIHMAVPWDSDQVQPATEPEKFIDAVHRNYHELVESYD